MGTASLVIGIILIFIGFGFVVDALFFNFYLTQEGMKSTVIGTLIISIPIIAAGGLFLRKYDRDKKKEKPKNS